jgi:primosomal protein N'
MRKIEEIGICPQCNCSISIFKTNNYKRFAKCEVCGMSYALPKRGSISNSAIICPRSELPVLIVDKKNHKAYFWTDQPCFSCVKYDKCKIIRELISEFTELKVYGY